MKKIIFVFLLGIFCVTFSSAQIIFQKVYIENFFMQHSQWATTCKNGGYAFITNVFTVVRTNEYGDTIWCKNYQASDLSWGHLIEQTTDNGFIVLGEVGANSPLDVILLKLDSNGNTLWCKAFDQGDWMPSTVKQTEDGGYILSFRSATSGAASIVKTGQNGNVVWSKEVAFGIGVDLLDVCTTSDGGYILSGQVSSSNFSNILLLRIDSAGNFIWSKRYGGNIPFKSESGNKVIQSTDGGFVVLGNSLYNGYQYDSLYVIKTNPSGSLIWAKNYGATYSIYDEGFGIVALKDNECAIISSIKDTSSQYGGPSLIRLNENGDTLWTKTFTAGINSVSVKSLSLTEDNGFLIGSHFSGNNGLGFYLIKTDSMGYSGCNEIHLHVNNISLPIYQQNIFLQISTGIQTHTESITPSAASCLIVSCPFDNSILEIKNESNFILYPNPATNEIKISNLSFEENQINICNLLGVRVAQSRSNGIDNSNDATINISDLTSGIYMLTVSNNKKISCKKFVKE